MLIRLIRATITCLDNVTIPRFFTTMVRPHLEYGNVILHPRFRRDSVDIEKVQRWATKLIPEINHLPYDKRLRALKLPSLQHRRRRGDMFQTYKTFFELSGASVTRGHNQKVVKKNMPDWEVSSQFTVSELLTIGTRSQLKSLKASK